MVQEEMKKGFLPFDAFALTLSEGKGRHSLHLFLLHGDKTDCGGFEWWSPMEEVNHLRALGFTA